MPPATQGIKYAGSKRRIIPHILEIVRDLNPKSVLDGFSGTTRVSQAFARAGYNVTANDAAIWSYHFGRCYLLSKKSARHYQQLLDHLNELPGRDGWFTAHYGGGPKTSKKPWQLHNTRKLDAVREEIDRLSLDEDDGSVALASLMLAMDQVDSTIGHYVSYLREWSPRSYKTMQLTLPAIIASRGPHRVRKGDVFEALEDTYDLAYFDPPYGSNNEKMPPSRVRYAAYYHLWTSICRFDKPEIFGKAGRRSDSSDPAAASVFEEFRRDESGRFIAVAALEKLIRQTKAGHILLSYSSGGRATAKELHEALERNGILKKVLEIDHRKNVMSGMRWTHQWIRKVESPHREFLFLLEKS